MKIIVFLPLILLLAVHGQGQIFSDPETPLEGLKDFRPLPEEDPAFSSMLEKLIRDAGLDERTAPEENPDKHEEWSSVCVVDISDIERPRVAGWKADNFVYPASAYKLYILGEAVRRICVGELSLDDVFTISEHNVRSGSRLEAGQKTTLSEILRLMIMYSDNTAANQAIDIVDRKKASWLLRSLGCQGSDITRKFLPRTLEDDGYSTVPGTTSSAKHFASFLWAAENGAIGGGKGRGLIRAFMSMTETGKDRVRAGLPDSATLYTKTGTWNIFTAEACLVEDGKTRYILCILAPQPSEEANPRIAEFTERLHNMMKKHRNF